MSIPVPGRKAAPAHFEQKLISLDLCEPVFGGQFSECC